MPGHNRTGSDVELDLTGGLPAGTAGGFRRGWELLVAYGDLDTVFDATLGDDLGLCNALSALDEAKPPPLILNSAAMIPPRSDLIRLRVHALTSLAASLLAQKRFTEAEAVLRRALELAEAAFPPGVELADVHRNVGRLYQDAGRFEDAEANYRHALAVVEHEAGQSHPDTASLLHNLAILCAATGRQEEANSLWAAARAVLDTEAL